MLFPAFAHAQYGNVWAFGGLAGLDFNQSPPQPIRTSISTNEGSASICGADGRLLFYTDGGSIWDRNNNLMPGGTDLPGLGRNITASTSQGALIVPIPGNDQQYYVFSLGAFESGFVGRLYYSIVDMSLNNGLGDVVAGSKGKLLSVNNTEQMMAVSGDNCNIWLMTAARAPQQFRVYNIDYKGIDTIPVTSDRLTGSGTYGGVIGTMDISPDRSKLIMAQGNLVLYDFDPATGKITQPLTLSLKDRRPFSYYGVVFSPDNSKLYASAEGDSLFQFDLSLQDSAKIVASRVTLGTAWAIKRGPDGKVYCASGSNYLIVIHQPNLPGLACQYEREGLYLLPNTNSILGLPNSATIVVNIKNYTTTSKSILCADSFLLQPQNPNGFNHKWDDGSSGPERYIDTSGTYWITYQAAAGKCEEYADTFLIEFKPIVRIYTTTNFEGMCRADTFRMRALNPASKYMWEDSSTARNRKVNQTGTYWVAYRVDSLCEQYADTFVAVYPEEDYRVSFTADTLACVQQAVTFTNTSDPHFDRFRWFFGDGNETVDKQPGHAYTGPGRYAVTLTGKIGEICPDTVTHFITIDSVYPISFSTDRQAVCVGERVAFYPHTDFSTTGLQWQFGDGSSRPEENGPAFYHAFDHPGLYMVQLTSTNRICPETIFTDSIRVHPIPQIDLGADAGLCLKASGLVLQNLLAPVANAYRNLWSTGDTTQSITISTPGTYSLTVTAETAGCSNTETVVVAKDCYTDIPNAFTPNGDGTNDYFFPRQLLSRSIAGFRMQIWNRWGQLLFTSLLPDGRGWDGKFNGKDQPADTYIYNIEMEIENGHTEKYTGSVTLLR